MDGGGQKRGEERREYLKKKKKKKIAKPHVHNQWALKDIFLVGFEDEKNINFHRHERVMQGENDPSLVVPTEGSQGFELHV